MSFEPSFASVLRAKMQGSFDSEAPSQHSRATFSELAPDLYQVLWSMGQSPARPPQTKAKSTYLSEMRRFRKLKDSPSPTTPPEVDMPPPQPQVFTVDIHELGPAEHKAWQSLRDLGSDQLPEVLSLAELKAAHRKLARRYHPDAGLGQGDSVAFQRAHEAYRCLDKAIRMAEQQHEEGQGASPAAA